MVFIYPGAIHIHSIYSDGTGTIEEIARAAKKARLSWIIISDHNRLEGKEGIYDGISVIIGEEISPENENHYIALDIKTTISPDMPPKEFIKEVKKQGGFGFIAHPDGKISRKNSYRALRWKDWSIKDFGGLEIWNYMSNWADHYNQKNFLNEIKAFLLRNRALSGPTKNVLKWWDDLNNETDKIIPAIGGLDVHAFNIKKMGITVKIFPYHDTFGTIVNNIYLDNPMPKDFKSQRKLILESIKSGRNLIANKKCSVFGKCKSNPVFYIQNKDKKAYAGESINIDNETKIIVSLPTKADIKISHNGKIILKKKTKKLELDKIKEGKYRLEVYYKGRPWAFSNPIIVNGK